MNYLHEAVKQLNRFYEQQLNEGTKYDKKAVKIIVDSGLFDESTSTKIIDALFKEDIHAFVHSPAWLEKYLVGIARMFVQYCNGDKSKAQTFLTECPNVFEQYLTIVKEEREKLGEKERISYDNKFNNEMSYEDVKNRLEKIQNDRDEKAAAELKDMKFESSNYELIPIDSYEQMHDLFGGHWTGDGSSDMYAGSGGTAWCHTNSKSVHDGWTNRGKFFVLAAKNWKDIQFNAESNAKNPKDDYGNSLIALLINPRTGILLNATLRCNHVGVSSNADNQYTNYAELSKIAGFNVQEAVKDKLGDTLINEKSMWKNFDGTKNGLREILYSLGIDRDEITSVYIPENVTELDDRCFYRYKSLQDVDLKNVTSLGDGCFYGCRSLQNIDLKNVSELGDDCFYCCDSLQAVDLKNVTELGNNCFGFCESLQSVDLKNVKELSDACFYDCESLQSIDLKNVTKLGNKCFMYCDSLQSIDLNNVNTLGAKCFYGCISLQSIDLKNVIEIGLGCFLNCDSLKEIICHNENQLEQCQELGYGDIAVLRKNTMKFKVVESIEKRPDVEYKGITIEHFPLSWKFKGETWDEDGWVIKSPYYIQSNSDKPKTFMPLYCENENGEVLNFHKLEDAKKYIDDYIVTKKGKIKIKHGDEVHFELIVIDEPIDEAYTKDQIRNKFYKHTFNSYKKSNGEDYATDMSNKLTNKFDDEDFEYVANWLNSMRFPLTVYRGYRIDDSSKTVYGDGVNLDNPGRHWTTDPQMFFNRGTIGNSKMNYIAVGEVDKNDVDWDSTINTFMYYSLPGKTQYGAYPENEIYLKKSTKPKNMKVYNRDDFTNKFYDSLNEKLLSAKLKKYDGVEGKKKYIHDFMKSDDAIKEFPDVKQRYAVCVNYWNNR